MILWSINDIELAVAIAFNILHTSNREGVSVITGHEVNCYAQAKEESEGQEGICVVRAVGNYPVMIENGKVITQQIILYPLFTTFKIKDGKLEIRYFDVTFKFNLNDLAKSVEEIKKQMKQNNPL